MRAGFFDLRGCHRDGHDRQQGYDGGNSEQQGVDEEHPDHRPNERKNTHKRLHEPFREAAAQQHRVINDAGKDVSFGVFLQGVQGDAEYFPHELRACVTGHRFGDFLNKILLNTVEDGPYNEHQNNENRQVTNTLGGPCGINKIVHY